jgi:predicted ribosome quality control (RQC) complex YloA/Tae2 family protein
MTIEIKKAAHVSAIGHHINKNSKPVFCITDGAVYASVLDAAEKVNADPGTMSAAINGKIKTCKGKRYCFVADVMNHLDEIAENLKIRNEKVDAYDAMMAEQTAKKEAQEKLAKQKAKCEELRKKLEAEMQLLAEAEALVGSEVE